MPIPRYARTKIVCTLGPATSTPAAIRGLMEEGLNVARVNFSHGTHEQHAQTIAMVREIAVEMDRPVAILADLQGPRIRIGDLPASLHVTEGQDVVFVPEGREKAGEIPITYEALADDVHTGDRILVDDGLLDFLVLDVQGSRVSARVIHGGELRSHKGMNLPGVQVSAPSITEKDHADVLFAIEHELDYVALSFVRRAEDISSLRALLPK